MRRWGKLQATAAIALVLGVTVLRAHYCTVTPVNTGDILRHLYYGLLAQTHGFEVYAGTLIDVDPRLGGVAWAFMPFNYPVLIALLSTALAAVWPTIFFAKLVLTLIEAANAWLVYRYTGHRWLGVLYWASPMSIWWVSHEAQYEPLQSFFVFVGLLALRTRPAVACACLALAIQVKVSAILLLPFFGVAVYRMGRRTALRGAVAFGLACIPTVAALSFYPAVTHVQRYMGPIAYNPYYWNFTDRQIFLWNPPWLIVWNQISSYVLLAAVTLALARSRERLGVLGLFLFTLACKLRQTYQFWYLVLLPSFALPLRERRWQYALFLALPLIEIRSTIQILFGPFGNVVGDYSGLTAFTRLVLPGS